MPDAHPRHSITGTPPVKKALDACQLRDDTEGAREAAARLADMVRRRAIPVDVDLAVEVKRLGLFAD
jgi:hypothetical protein